MISPKYLVDYFSRALNAGHIESVLIPEAHKHLTGLTELIASHPDGADLRFANLTGANLTGTKLRGCDLTGAVITRANFTDADLTGATMPSRG